ncbi:MAG: Flagellar hook-basal body complex protein FliE [Pseudomonadota bacterium]|jgi:flagellar hook-basal body complex protein FliE
MAITPTPDAQYLLSQIQRYQSAIQQTRLQGGAAVPPPASGVEGRNFASTISDAVARTLQEVNATQQASQTMMARFESGENVPLTDVVLAMQKSSLAFEATLQVRNKVLKAYEDIMNMPV